MTVIPLKQIEASISFPRLVIIYKIFLMEKANERSGHLMVSDQRCPRTCASPEERRREVTGALPAFKVETDVLFEGTHVIST